MSFIIRHFRKPLHISPHPQKRTLLYSMPLADELLWMGDAPMVMLSGGVAGGDKIVGNSIVGRSLMMVTGVSGLNVLCVVAASLNATTVSCVYDFPNSTVFSAGGFKL